MAKPERSLAATLLLHAAALLQQNLPPPLPSIMCSHTLRQRAAAEPPLGEGRRGA